MNLLLDTNVLSELRRPRLANANVRRWADQVDRDQTFLSVISILEIERGAEMVRKTDAIYGDRLRAWLHREVLPGYGERILPIGLDVAIQCGRFGHVQAGHFADALLAATAIVHEMILVTRNVGDFTQFNVPLINPWDLP